MTRRITVSLADDTAQFVEAHAEAQTGGNVSAYFDHLVRRHMLSEALRNHPVPDWGDAFSAYDAFGHSPDSAA